MEATFTTTGALIGLALAILLIIKKVHPAYSLILGALVGGLIGGGDLVTIVNTMVLGAQGMMSSILRILTSGILAGALIKTGSAEKIAELKAARDKAYVTVNTQWTWINDTADHKGAFVFKSGTDGYFKVTGLKAGAYQLIETKQPDGYAKLTKPVDFTIAANSTGETTKLETGKLQDNDGFTQVENKKITIPQTGGIGTIIFTAIGLAIMASAIIAIKKRQATEAR